MYCWMLPKNKATHPFFFDLEKGRVGSFYNIRRSSENLYTPRLARVLFAKCD